MSQFQQNSITALVNSYGLCFEGIEADTIVATWIQEYESDWIVKAIVEAVFRGRYKVRSVDDILKQWKRLGKPLYHFEPAFERERLEKFSIVPLLFEISISPSSIDSAESLNEESLRKPSLTLNSQDLNPDELTPFHHSHSAILPTSYLDISSDFDGEESLVMNHLKSPTVAVVLDVENEIIDLPISEKILPKRMQLLDKLKIAIGEESISEGDVEYLNYE